MPDRETVINDLQDAVNDDWMWQHADFYARTMEKAIQLLKEQEPVPIGKIIKAGDVVLRFYECGYCKNAIRKPWKYCPFCGKAVKWDADGA